MIEVTYLKMFPNRQRLQNLSNQDLIPIVDRSILTRVLFTVEVRIQCLMSPGHLHHDLLVCHHFRLFL